MSPDGKVLAGKHDYKDFKNGARELLDTLEAGLQAFGPVEPRKFEPTNPLPRRGAGVQEDGSVTLALYGRQMLGGGVGTMPPGVTASRAWIWNGPYRADGPSMVDSLTLSAEEWKGFHPSEAKAGATWTIPEPLARKLVRLISSSSDQSGMPRPEEATAAEVRATVESVEGDVARIRLAGRWECVHLPEGRKERVQYGASTAAGRAEFDLGRKSMTSLTMIFDSTIRHGRPDAEPGRTGGVLEWRR